MKLRSIVFALTLLALSTAAFAEEPRAYPLIESKKIIQKLGQEWEPPPPGARGLAVEPPPSITVSILFIYDSTEIADDESLKQVAEAAKAFKDAQLKEYKFLVEGHTDADGEEAYNKKLSERRAAAITQLLTGRYGVSSAMLTPAGKGESEPVADNTSDPGKQKNRRVVIMRAK